MSDEIKAHSFGGHHQRHLRTTFQYIDKLLSEAEHTMADAGSLAEPVGGVLQSIEQTRDALDEAMQLAASASNGTALDELPKPTGMPMLDVSEISKQIVIEKPAVLSPLAKGMVASHVQRKLESEYDRALLEFLSLYANRLRRWMEQSINALRSLHSPTCIACALKLRRLLLRPICPPSKAICRFCATGRLLIRILSSPGPEILMQIADWGRAAGAYPS